MSGSTSFNLMNKLNEADTNAIEIKKKVFIEGSNVRVEETNLKKLQMNESENLLKESKVIWSDQIDTSEETYNAEWRDAGYSSAEEAIADGFPDYDAWVEGDRYAESEILLDDLKNNILPQIENQANLDYIFLTGNYNSNYPDFRPSGSGGVTLKGIDELNDYLAKWDSVTIFEEDGNIGVKCTDHDGSVELMLYTFATDNEEELAKMLGYTEDNFDEFENDLYYKSIDTNIINDHPEAIKPIADTITAFNESEEAIKKDLNIESGSDEEAELDNILNTNYNDLFDNLDDEEKEEYNKIAATIRDLKPEEALIDVIDEIKNKAKENGLEEDLLLFAYLNKRKINEAATDLPTEQSDEDRLASLKVQLAKDGDQLADDEKESIEKEIADLEAKLFPIDETDESKGKIKKSFEESVTQKDLPDNCYDFNDNTNQIIIIKKGQTGYYPTDIEFENKEQAEDIINKANEALKVTPEQRDAMRAASMFGWNTTDNITEDCATLKEEFIDSMTYVVKLSNGKEALYKPSKSYSTSEWFKDFQNSHPEAKSINDVITTKEATKEDIARLQNNTNESNNTILDNTTDKLNETGEWDDNDEDMQMWLEDLRDQAKELAAEVKGEVKSVTGFDAYQGPRAIVHTPKHGDIEMWYDQEDDRGLTFNCKVAHVGWINGGINQLAEILNQDTIDDNEIISESEDTKPHKKADRQFIIALIKSGALDDIDTLEKEGGFEDAVDYWVNHYYDDYTDAELKDLDETAKSANDKLHEAQVKGLRTVKSQGNIYMLEDDNKQIIVGENYNSTEKLIENANIYFNKKEADKDYFNRCGITLKESAEQDSNNKSTNLYDRCYHINDREELKEIALNAIYVANNDQKIIDELNDRLVDLEKEECHDYLVKFSEAPYDFVANNYTNIPLELLREIALNAVYVANDDEAIEKEIKDRIVEYDETYKTSEKDLSKDLYGSEAEKRQSEADRALEKYLDLAREIKAGNNDTITLDSAKQLLKNAYIKAKCYYSFEPEEIDRRIAKDIPDLFGDLEEGVISDLKATHLAKKAAKLSKEKDFGKSAKAFAKSMEINDKSANKLDNKAKKLEDKAGKLRNEAIVKRNKSVKDFTSKK